MSSRLSGLAWNETSSMPCPTIERCIELGLFLIDIATDEELLSGLKTGLGLQSR